MTTPDQPQTPPAGQNGDQQEMQCPTCGQGWRWGWCTNSFHKSRGGHTEQTPKQSPGPWRRDADGALCGYNTDLIAAAPDLLAACKRRAAYAANHSVTDAEEAIDAEIRAAIAKAEGREG